MSCNVSPSLDEFRVDGKRAKVRAAWSLLLTCWMTASLVTAVASGGDAVGLIAANPEAANPEAVSPVASNPAPGNAAGPTWQTEVIASGVRRMAAITNANRMAVEGNGQVHLVYLERNAEQDRLVHLQGTPGAWRRETIAIMRHGTAAGSGIQSYALALAPDGRPHVYWFSSNHAGERFAFEERWAWRGDATGRWQIRTVRQQVNSGGGASIDAPHLAISSRQRFHLTAYVHNAYGVVHRARHRTVAGKDFPIQPLPSPPGKTDSGESNVCVDGQDRVHVAYSTTLALRDGNAEPGYPSASLTYATWQSGQWSAPELVVPRIGRDEADLEPMIKSVGLMLEGPEVHIVYAAGYRLPGPPMRVEYVRGKPGAWHRWVVDHVETARDPAPQAHVSNPQRAANGDLHFGIGLRESTRAVSGQGTNWQQSTLAGRMQGLALEPTGRVLVFTQTEDQLLLHRSRP